MSHFFQRSSMAGLPMAVRGEGCYLHDETGRTYLDAFGGAAVACLGHSHPRVVAEIEARTAMVASTHTSSSTDEPNEELADFLVARAPAGIERFLTVSDGSAAVETALKLQRQYWIERGQPKRRHIISRKQSDHGNTIGALSVGRNPHSQASYETLLARCVAMIEPAYAYRHRRDEETVEQYGIRAADLLESEILRLGAENVSAFIAEPTVGVTTGCVTAPPGYFRRIREICDRYGVLFIADETMCGMGRTGTLFASEQEGVVPDIIAVAAGLGDGDQPVGGVFAHRRVIQPIEAGTKAVAKGNFRLGHPTADAAVSAAALTVQQVIEDEGLLERVRHLGDRFRQKLVSEFGGHPNVGDIRGRGLFWALEFVRDRDSKETFEPGFRLHERIRELAMIRGLVCFSSGGTADGIRGDHILFAPPYLVSEAQLDDLVEITRASLRAALKTKRWPRSLHAVMPQNPTPPPRDLIVAGGPTHGADDYETSA